MSVISKLKSVFQKKSNKAIKEIQHALQIESPIVIEAGAHIGSDSVEMSKIWPKGIIHAFEPIPEIYNKLVSNTRGYKNILTYPVALSNQTGTASIFVSSGASDGSSSLLAPKEHISEHPDVQFAKVQNINTITLDDWAAQNKIDHVDFAWLDMQGFELSMLKASENILKNIKVIYTEVSLKEMYEGVILYPEMKSWMEKQGFQVAYEDFRWTDMGNVLFVRKRNS